MKVGKRLQYLLRLVLGEEYLDRARSAVLDADVLLDVFIQGAEFQLFRREFEKRVVELYDFPQGSVVAVQFLDFGARELLFQAVSKQSPV